MMSTVVNDTSTGPHVAQMWKTRQDKVRTQWSSILLLTPALGLLAVLFLVPLAFAVYLGLTNLTLLGPTSVHWGFSGLANLQQLFVMMMMTMMMMMTFKAVERTQRGHIGHSGVRGTGCPHCIV